MHSAKNTNKQYKFLYFIGLIIAALPLITLFYGNWAFLGYDDTVAVVTNPHIANLNLENLKWMMTEQELGAYEPISWFIKAVIIYYFGYDKFYFHIVSASFHLLNSLLVMICCNMFILLYNRQKQIQEDQKTVYLRYFISASIGVLFSIAPLHAEVVAWVSAQAYTVGLFLLLMSVTCYVSRFFTANNSTSSLLYILSILFYGLSVLGKSATLLLPFCFIVIDLIIGTNRQVFIRLILSFIHKIPFLIITIIAYYLIYQANLEGMGGTITSLPWPERIGRAIMAIFIYPLQMIWPFHLSPSYEIPQWDISFWAPLPLSLLIISLFILIFALFNGEKMRWILAALIAYVVLITPVLGFVQRGEIMLHADRYTYIGTFPLYLMLAVILYRFVSKGLIQSALMKGALLVIALIFGYLQYLQLNIWRSDETLWQHALKIHPHNAFAANNLGYLYFENQELELGRHYLEIAYKFSPSVRTALNLGPLYYSMGRCPLALDVYNEALENDKDNFAIYHNMANCFYQLKDFALAQEYYQRAIELNPQHPMPQQALQNMYNDPEYQQLGQTTTEPVSNQEKDNENESTSELFEPVEIQLNDIEFDRNE